MFIELIQQFLGIAPESCLSIEYTLAGILFLFMFISFVIFLYAFFFFVFKIFRK